MGVITRAGMIHDARFHIIVLAAQNNPGTITEQMMALSSLYRRSTIHKKDKLQTFDLIQSGDWGIRVAPSRDLYDFEFGANADRLRTKLGGEIGDAN